jgi:hypothetical protein
MRFCWPWKLRRQSNDAKSNPTKRVYDEALAWLVRCNKRSTTCRDLDDTYTYYLGYVRAGSSISWPARLLFTNPVALGNSYATGYGRWIRWLLAVTNFSRCCVSGPSRVPLDTCALAKAGSFVAQDESLQRYGRQRFVTINSCSSTDAPIVGNTSLWPLPGMNRGAPQRTRAAIRSPCSIGTDVSASP